MSAAELGRAAGTCVVGTPSTFLCNQPPFGNLVWLDHVWVSLDPRAARGVRGGDGAFRSAAAAEAAGDAVPAVTWGLGAAEGVANETRLWVTNCTFQGPGGGGDATMGVLNGGGKMCLKGALPHSALRFCGACALHRSAAAATCVDGPMMHQCLFQSGTRHAVRYQDAPPFLTAPLHHW